MASPFAGWAGSAERPGCHKANNRIASGSAFIFDLQLQTGDHAKPVRAIAGRLDLYLTKPIKEWFKDVVNEPLKWIISLTQQEVDIQWTMWRGFG
jgi:hypothetical protein